MLERLDDKMADTIMTIPKSILFNTLKDAIATKDDNRIGDLTDLLYANFELHAVHAAQGSENSRRMDLQHQEIQNSLEMMREGFKNMDKRFEAVDKRFEVMDKRFDDLIHHMDKRFEAVDKRFEAVEKRFEAVDKRFETVNKRFDDLIHHMDKRFSLLAWMIGIGFVVINSIMLLIRFIG